MTKIRLGQNCKYMFCCETTMAISENPPTGCDAIERHWGWTERFSLEIWMTNAPINVTLVGGDCGQGGDLMPETIPLSGFWSCEATLGSGHLTLTDRSLGCLPFYRKIRLECEKLNGKWFTNLPQKCHIRYGLNPKKGRICVAWVWNREIGKW